jgi:hypothetical protein
MSFPGAAAVAGIGAKEFSKESGRSEWRLACESVLAALADAHRGRRSGRVRAVHHLELDGRLPTNTHGGQLGEGYLHGVNGIAEGVRLIRGASVNQTSRPVRNVLVTGGSPVPHSAVVRTTDR